MQKRGQEQLKTKGYPKTAALTSTLKTGFIGEKQKNPQPKGWDFTSQDISQVIMSTDYKSFS